MGRRKSEASTDPAKAPRDFTVLLAQIEDGGLRNELSEEVHELNTELAALAYDNGKAKGSITLTINFAHTGNGVVHVTRSIATKVPKVTGGESIFWVNGAGQLVNENPKQQKLGFKDVNAAEQKARDVFAESGLGHERQG